VAGGDHDAALPVEVLDRKIERGGGHHADADHIDPGGQEARYKRVVVRGRGMAAVIADDRTADAPACEIGAAGFPKMGHPFGVEVLVHDAADIISAEYVACVHFFPPGIARCLSYGVRRTYAMAEKRGAGCIKNRIGRFP